MPELPEVETVARQLHEQVAGRRIARVVVQDDKLAGLDTRACAGRTILGVRRVGKQVVFDLGGKPRSRHPVFLAVHLRMTGRLLWLPNGVEPPPKHRLELRLDDGRVMFCDVRRFGTVSLHRDERELAPKRDEPLAPGFSARRLGELVAGSGQEIKTWLLRQDRLVGLGNIYASEILFAARVHPRRAAVDLEYAEIKRIHRATRRILRKAIDHCGTTFSDFQDSQGRVGGYARYLKVYAHEKDTCPRCKHPIARIVQQQRSTFFCPDCQR